MGPNKDNHFCILIAVWGEKYCKDFLNLSLPSLLASGNIPALAKICPTKFVFLTRLCDINAIKHEPIYDKLASVCEIDFISVEDLIVFGNYSTTLTLAYDRAIKLCGDAMLNTYFIFLTSDYIMANGSMEGLLRYLNKGYSGVCAGNFQVLRTEMEAFVKKRIDQQSLSLTISPRELLKESLQHLHPIVMASFYNQKVIHNYYVNRFFYPYNPNLLVGRFYLLHMLCIKPEVTNYKIGASCDYSFIPAMCPSGNVGIIADSDDYLVVEVQSKEHEIGYISWGEYKEKKLVSALTQWTTKEHRSNAKHSIYFHVEDLTHADQIVIEENLNTYVDKIGAALQKYPAQPSYNHPYWRGALNAFQVHRRVMKNSGDHEYVDFQELNTTSMLKKMFYMVFGLPPNVYPWHYRFQEYTSVKKILTDVIKTHDVDNVIVAYDSYEVEIRKFYVFFKETLKIKKHYYMRNLLESGLNLHDLRKNQIAIFVYVLNVDSLNFINHKIAIIQEILKKDGKLILLVPNERNQFPDFVYNFRDEFAHRINYVMGNDLTLTKIIPVHNTLTLAGTIIVHRIQKMFSYSKKIKILIFLLIGIPGSLYCTFMNLLPKFRRKSGHCTNIIAELVPKSEEDVSAIV